MRTISIVQARMGSSRFPGKTLEPLWGDMSLLDIVLRRVLKANTLDLVVLATSDRPIDDALVPVAESMGVEVFRGSEDDVLGRFCGTVAKFPTGAIVRVCADNPLVDPVEIDKLVDFFWKSQPCDYACNDDKLDCGLPDGVGVEVFSASALERLDRIVSGDLRQHVANYAIHHPDEFRLGRLETCGPLRRPEIRLDVDYPEDLERLRIMMQSMNHDIAPYWSTLEAIEAFDAMEATI